MLPTTVTVDYSDLSAFTHPIYAPAVGVLVALLGFAVMFWVAQRNYEAERSLSGGGAFIIIGSLCMAAAAATGALTFLDQPAIARVNSTLTAAAAQVDDELTPSAMRELAAAARFGSVEPGSGITAYPNGSARLKLSADGPTVEAVANTASDVVTFTVVTDQE